MADTATAASTEALLWPEGDAVDDLAQIESVPLEARGLPETTWAIVERAAQHWPDKLATRVLRDAEHWVDSKDRTFAELRGDVIAAANALHELGVGRGDPAALLSPNCDELITAVLAAQLAGIAQPINPALAAEHVAELLARSGARILVASSPEFHPQVFALAEGLARRGDLDALVLLGPTFATDRQPVPDIPGVTIVRLTDAAAAQSRDVFAGALPTADDLAGLFHTGGTTGVPKLAAHTHRNEVVDSWALGISSTFDEGSVFFAGLPLFHVNALMVTLLSPLLHGQTSVWAGPAGYRDPAFYTQFWHIVEHYRIATLSGVPTVYAALAAQSVNADISSLRAVVVGASPLPPGVRAAFEAATGVPMLEGYGLTEATCASVRGFVGGLREGLLGQRMPYQQMKAVRIDPNGQWNDLPAGDVGVLAISGPTVFAGYVQGRGPDGEVALDGLGKLHNGWLDTGDLAAVDADGWVRLAGRAKDLIIRGGHNIDPAVIEDALLSHPAVVAAGAVGRPDAHSGEVPVAYVVLAPGADATPSELVLWAKSHVSEAAAAPKQVYLLASLPVTDVGKPNKLPLRADAARRAIEEALDSVPGIARVEAVVDAGAIRILLHLASDTGAPAATEQAAGHIMDAFVLDWVFARASQS